MTETTKEQKQENGAINLAIFEQVMGAKRMKLEQDLCGLVYQGKAYGCFEGHAAFDDQSRWEAQYGGPDFCQDFVWIFAAEAAIAKTGLLGRYVEALVKRIYPKWNSISDDKEIVDFWYALAHASPLNRTKAMSEALAIQSRKDLEQVIAGAIRLAIRVALADGEAKTRAEHSFLDYVGRLEPQRAEELLAVMFMGRGDHSSLEAALRAASGSSGDRSALAQRMTGELRLLNYLRDGLAKLLSAE